MQRPKRSRKSETSGCTPGALTSWTARTTTATDVAIGRPASRTPVSWYCQIVKVVVCALVVGLLTPTLSHAQSVRSHTRNTPRSTAVSKDQAVDMTLTVTPVATRPIQVWVRTAAAVTGSSQLLEAFVAGGEAPFVKIGQRVRAFPVESRSSMY